MLKFLNPDKLLPFFILFVANGVMFAQSVTINEVMFDAIGIDDYDEFIEIVNIGDASIDLQGFYLEINGYVDSIDFKDDSTSLESGAYALIFDQGYQQSGTYEGLIPATALRCTIHDNYFGTSGLKNSVPNIVLLLNSDGDTLSAATTSPDQDAGYSDEKIDVFGDNDQTNWGNAISLYGTPGYENSIAMKDSDLAITDFRRLNEDIFPIPGTPVEFILKIQNLGRNIIENADVVFGIDQNQDSMLHYSEILYNDILTISPLDSVVLYPTLPMIRSGSHEIMSAILLEDEMPENNDLRYTLWVPYEKGAVLINEFMYAPKSDHGGEWIELLNISPDTIDLAHWKICDEASGIAGAVITSSRSLVAPNSLVVLSSDATLENFWEIEDVHIVCEKKLPSLNDTGDSIIVRDLCGVAIDSLKYSSAWGKQTGVALERIDPHGDSNLSDNWALSADTSGGTPGRQNSCKVKSYDISLDELEILSENIFNGDYFETSFRLMNKGIENVSTYSIRFRIENQDSIENSPAVLDSVVNYSITLMPGEFSIRTVDFHSVSGGAYTLFATVVFEEDENLQNNSDSCDLVIGYPVHSIIINEVMNIPETGESEWFEIYNPVDFPVDLNRWRFRDANGTWKYLITQPKILEPNDFCIIAASRDFLQAYPAFDGPMIIPQKFPILNNSSDSLFLVDATGHSIETVYFRQDWGGGTGISIERRDPNAPAQTENNWGSSTDPAGATPGAINSILKYQRDLSIIPTSFRFVDSTVSLIRPVKFMIEVKNNGSIKSGKFSLEIYYDRDRSESVTPDEIVWSLHSIPALLPDSVIFLDGEFYSETSGRCRYIAMVAMTEDENIFDNTACRDLLVAYPKGSLLFNEFLAYPRAEQTEFCEIVNVSSGNINFGEWRFSNSRSTAMILQTRDLNISPGEYIVLAKDSSFFEKFPTVTGKTIIPEKCPGLNNSIDKIILKDLTGTVIDSLAFDDSWNVMSGVSLEKKLPVYQSHNVFNWFLSTDPTGATPGRKNSVMPLAYDIQLDSVVVFPETGSSATEFQARCWFTNVGLNKSSPAELAIIQKSLSGSQTIKSVAIKSLEVGESDSILINFGKFNSGYYHLALVALWEYDSNRMNDTLNFSIRVAFEKGALLLSEFMASPLIVKTTGGSIAEYIEIYNPNDETLLEAWSICDENTGAPVKIFTEKAVGQGGFFVIANDSTIFQYDQVLPENTIVLPHFPSLGNTEDGIYLIGPAGTIVDSLKYDSGWSITQNKSMERVYYTNPNLMNNWRLSTAAAGGTPGYKNSVAITDESVKPGIKVTPNPFSPNGDGIDEQVAIQFLLPFPSANVNMQIYDMMGRLIFEPAKNLPSSSEGAVYWDGSSIHGNRARIGMYVVRCSATDATSDKTVGYITTVVLAR